MANAPVGNIYTAALMQHNSHPDYKYEMEGVPVRMRVLTPAVAMSSPCSFVLKMALLKRRLLLEAVARYLRLLLI